MTRVTAVVFVVAAMLRVGAAGGSVDDPRQVPKALQPFEQLIGEWNAHGFLESDKLQGWEEPTTWGWRFEKGRIAGMEVTFKSGRYFVAATLDPTDVDSQYRFTGITPDQKKATYEGLLKGKKLILSRQTNDVPAPEQVTIELLHDVRYQMLIEARKSATSMKKIATIGATRADVRFGAASKEELGPKCIITGAPGTSTVAYNGQTYFVCCSGCRAEFEHDPEKWLKLAKEAKLKKGAGEPSSSDAAASKDPAKGGSRATPSASETKDESKKSPPKQTGGEKAESDSKSAAALLTRAKLLEKNGKREAAIQNYERLLKEYPKSKEAAEAEQRLKELRAEPAAGSQS